MSHARCLYTLTQHREDGGGVSSQPQNGRGALLAGQEKLSQQIATVFLIAGRIYQRYSRVQSGGGGEKSFRSTTSSVSHKGRR